MKVRIKAYKAFASVLTYGVLLGAFCAFLGFTYFIFGKNWIVPVVISPGDLGSLELLSKVVESDGAIAALTVDCERLRDSITEMTNHRASLVMLGAQLDNAIKTERFTDRQNGEQLATLNAQKRSDIEKTAPVIDNNAVLRSSIQADLGSGLITKVDASQALLQLQAADNSFTDGRIAEVLIRDQVRSHITNDTTRLDIMSKQTDLISVIANLDINIATAQKTWREESEQVRLLKHALDITARTPQSKTFDGDSITAVFIPYGTNAKIGDAVTDCIIGIVGCYKVGTITAVFPQEQHGQNPVPSLFSKTDIRGVLAQVTLNKGRENSVKSKVLFLGRPLWIL